MKKKIVTLSSNRKIKKCLREQSQDVVEFNDDLNELVERMIETNAFYHGIGLAAPQVGVNLNVVILDKFPDKKGIVDDFVFPFVLINPKWSPISNQQKECIEGCLSIPKKQYTVSRYEKINVTAQDVNGRNIVFHASDLFSYCIQHECQHLEGILLCDVGKVYFRNDKFKK
jgi:peptide deformylase